LVDSSAVAGICLLRLGGMRPAVFTRVGLPARIGWGAENAAHRIAVGWDDAQGTYLGVSVPKRRSVSWLAVTAGGFGAARLGARDASRSDHPERA
jgi:hypothetical protein